MPAFVSAMSRTEMFLAGGSALILLTDLIFIFISGYSVSSLMWAAAALLLAAILLKKRLPASLLANFNWLLLGLAGVIVLIGIRWFIGDLVWIATRIGRLDGPYLLGMIGVYAGAALVGLGAWQLWKGRA
jgi:hypothetical protein